MLKTTELFINELEEHELTYEPVRVLEDGDEMVQLGAKLDNTFVQLIIFFDADEDAVAIRCFDLVRVSEEQYPKALMSCNALNDRMRWVKFCIDKERNVQAEVDAVIDDTNAGKVTMNLVLRMASIIDDAYPVINKAIWS
mgnify:FL=1